MRRTGCEQAKHMNKDQARTLWAWVQLARPADYLLSGVSGYLFSALPSIRESWWSDSSLVTFGRYRALRVQSSPRSALAGT